MKTKMKAKTKVLSIILLALAFISIISFVESGFVIAAAGEIPVTQAAHLDANRQFISDIYEEVRTLDGVWSEPITAGHYVRVMFDKNLTSSNDITIYPRIINGNPKIEIYEINSNEKIAELTNIQSNQNNRVLLTDLQGTQDRFDLRILDGAVEFDYITDPAVQRFFDNCADMTVNWTINIWATDVGLCHATKEIGVDSTKEDFNLAGETNVTITFTWSTVNLDGPGIDFIAMQVCNDGAGGSWVNLWDHYAAGAQESASGSEYFLLQDYIAPTANMRLQLNCSASGGGEICSFDDINVTVYTVLDDPPVFTVMEMQESTPNEDQDMQLNITVSGATNDLNSVWLFWQGVTNYTYPYGYVYNDTTATTEFWINISSDNYTAHDDIGYEWWANTSTGKINATQNYTYIIANQVPPDPSFTQPPDRNKTTNTSVVFRWSTSTDADDEDIITYYGFINGTGATPTYNFSTTSTEIQVNGFDDGDYRIDLWAFDEYDNSSTNDTIYFTVHTTPPTFSSMERQEDPNNEDQDLKLNITLDAHPFDFNSVWVFIQGSRNYTYPYSYVYNDTTATTEFWINLTSGNYSAHQTFGYQWWANCSVGGINATQNYTFTIANQVPTVTGTTLNETSPVNNDVLSCSGSFQDDDAGDEEQSTSYDWWVNNVSQATNTNELHLSGYSERDEIICSKLVYDGYDNSTWYNSSNVATIQDETPPQFDSMVRNPDPPNDVQDVTLNITVTDSASDINSVWIQWNGTTNWTYPYGYVYNDTTASTEFWITVGSGNYSAGDEVKYSWWANDSAGNINSTANYTFTVTSDTCTYGGGDWHVLCSDNCNIGSNVYMPDNVLYINGASGSFTVNADITVEGIRIEAGCRIINEPFDGKRLIIEAG